jgi:two-component system chemotaxis response regulator CheY
MRILIVEDSGAMRMHIAHTLRLAGYGDHELIEAANGVEALLAVEQCRPDLVLSDWHMPKMSGIQLLQQLNMAGMPPKFGFVTWESSPTIRVLAAHHGALFLIAKPFTAETFRQALDPVLNQRHPPALTPSLSGVADRGDHQHEPSAPTTTRLVTTLPPADLVGKLLTELVNLPVTVTKGPAPTLDLSQPATVAVYVHDNGMTAAACVCDLALTASLGAALALIPAAAAHEAIEQHVLPAQLLDNHREVVNVAARLFNRPSLAHVRLREVYVTPALLPLEAVNLVAGETQRLDLEVEINGYPPGRLWLFTPHSMSAPQLR